MEDVGETWIYIEFVTSCVGRWTMQCRCGIVKMRQCSLVSYQKGNILVSIRVCRQILIKLRYSMEIE